MTKRSDIVRWARQMEGHLAKVQGLLWRIRDSDHPLAEALHEGLSDECGAEFGVVAMDMEDVARQIFYENR